MLLPVSYPGVYIAEFEPPPPLQPAGTSTAAFLGPCPAGPPNVPTKLTSWDDFKRQFGDQPLAGFYLYYAVRGFFENGGTVCYVTRVSNAQYASRVLKDKSSGAGADTISVRALDPGVPSPAIAVAVDDNVHVVDPATAKLFRPTATIQNASGTDLTMTSAADAQQFRPGDLITWSGSTESKPSTVFRADGAVVRVQAPLSKSYSAGAVRLANPDATTTVVRIQNADKLEPGSVIRLTQGGTNATATVAQVAVERVSDTLTTYRALLRQPLGAAFDLTAGDVTVGSFEFRVTVTQGSATTTYDELSMDPGHPRYFLDVIRSDDNRLVEVEPVAPPNTTTPPDNRPRTLAATNLAGGADDNLATLAGSDYRDALALLEPIDDINMVAIPDRTDASVQTAVIDHCERMQDRFAILDAKRGAAPFGGGSVQQQRAGVESAKGFASLYYPWLWVPPASGNQLVLVPPSGHMAGVYARIDATRGVHKAPAGDEAIVSGAIAVERGLSNVDHGQLNLSGINVIRSFGGGRPTVYGARTTTHDTNWQYVNVRRLFLFLETTIRVGLHGAVFQPNNLALWQGLKRTLGAFLRSVWESGALFGATPKDAYYVRIDEALNPFSEQALGRLNIEIGARPTYPAEFIIVRIGIWQGGSAVSES